MQTFLYLNTEARFMDGYQTKNQISDSFALDQVSFYFEVSQYLSSWSNITFLLPYACIKKR